ncbi:unnamed protein product, partial [Allacma fusca]
TGKDLTRSPVVTRSKSRQALLHTPADNRISDLQQDERVPELLSIPMTFDSRLDEDHEKVTDQGLPNFISVSSENSGERIFSSIEPPLLINESERNPSVGTDPDIEGELLPILSPSKFSSQQQVISLDQPRGREKLIAEKLVNNEANLLDMFGVSSAVPPPPRS